MKTNLDSIFSIVKGILRTEEKWGNLIPFNLLQKEIKMPKNKIEPVIQLLIDEKFLTCPKEGYWLRVK